MDNEHSGDFEYGNSGEGGEAQDRRDGMLSELARKAVTSSVTRLVETEGFVREIVKAMSREFAAYVGREVSGLRQDVVGQASDKMVQWLDKIDLAGEIRRSMDGMTFDIDVKVRISDDSSSRTGSSVSRSTTRTSKPAGKTGTKKSSRSSSK